jgi:Tol biopolymer transport system component
MDLATETDHTSRPGHRHRKLLCGAIGTVAITASLLAHAGPAAAVQPGANGRIACEGARITGGAANNSEVFTINPDGTGELVLTNHILRDGDPSFSPDGTKIAFESYRSGFSELWTMNADGTGLTQLTFNGAPEDRGSSWTPDGTQIVYHTTEFPAGAGHSSFEIMIINTDGTGKTRLTNNLFQDSLPSVSPDGTKIAFFSTRDGDGEIYVMNIDGSNVTRLTNSPGEDAHPMWSPDGSQITFHTRRFGTLDIMVMNADGSNPRLVTTGTTTTHEYFPVWSPDGTKIAFNGTTLDPSNTDLYTINVDGTGLTRLTTAGGFDGRCDWGRLSPTDLNQCKKGGYQQFNSPTFERFRNQGQCMAYMQANADAGKRAAA